MRILRCLARCFAALLLCLVVLAPLPAQKQKREQIGRAHV
jgi:hypothetical protein